MSTLCTESLIHHCRVESSKLSGQGPRTLLRPCNCSLYRRRPRNLSFHGRRFFCHFKPPLEPLSRRFRACSNSSSSARETTVVDESSDVVFKETFALKQTSMIEGKISIRFDHEKDEQNWKLIVGCDLPGKWLLHWGVSYINDIGNEWDQPPKSMIPPGSIHVKDYAIETPMKNSSSSSEGDSFQEVVIDFDPTSSIAAIHFVLKDELTGAWYQHKGRDFKVPLVKYLQGDGYVVGLKKAFSKLAVPLGTLSSMFLRSEALDSKDEDSSDGESRGLGQDIMPVEGFHDEIPIAKGVEIINSITVSVRKCSDTGENVVYMETDLLGDVVIHWGVCRDEARKWEIPESPLPTDTINFKSKALRTLLKEKDDGTGSCGLFTVENRYEGFLFVIKQNESPWLSCMGNDFHVPLLILSVSKSLPVEEQSEVVETAEIEKLASEAYSMFSSSNGTPTLEEEEASKVEESKPQPPPVATSSGTGTGYEILVQGFNWESHKSRKWYKDIKAKAEELASLGFTVIWLPPPTESVSPEGYMPKDLYNLNSRYGTMEELKDVVKKFHSVDMKVLGDVVLNHRCAHYQNQNGVWNIFGGHLNWDDRAIVADDPHFQGRGNKSSGDNFHAAPNIDHSQEFVRKDIKEWLWYLRKVIGYDGWRLDFVRGFWGGYVKDYIEASGPYFAVGEFWDSLSYTYDSMDHNQDPHRQRIIDWINATNGAAGAFDVTTKGILHAALERCEYWRLSDGRGNPPGVLGWWPSRAVTFIENHDTGSTQGHWRFPGGKEMQGYAYILTHPGTPSVFYDHIFSQYRDEIASLINLRKMRKINCRSKVQITKAERDVYAAVIDDRVAMKIGPGHHQPVSDDSHLWALALEGREYKVWITV